MIILMIIIIIIIIFKFFHSFYKFKIAAHFIIGKSLCYPVYSSVPIISMCI